MDIEYRVWSREHRRMFSVYAVYFEPLLPEKSLPPGATQPASGVAYVETQEAVDDDGNIGLYNNFELLQYTGYKDEDGVKIFAGDIVRRTCAWGEVYWSEALGRWVIDSADGGHQVDKALPLAGYRTKILGNVYENGKMVGRRP